MMKFMLRIKCINIYKIYIVYILKWSRGNENDDITVNEMKTYTKLGVMEQ